MLEGPALLSQVSIVSIATCYKLDCSGSFEPWSRARFFTLIHTGPGPNPIIYTMVTKSSPGVQGMGHGTDRKAKETLVILCKAEDKGIQYYVAAHGRKLSIV